MKNTDDIDPLGLYRLAESVLGPTALEVRCGAILGRQSIELALSHLWLAVAPEIRKCPFRDQFLCLPVYLGDEVLAIAAQAAWTALSDVCHHHPYELTPSEAELHSLLRVVRAFAEEVRQWAVSVGP